MEDSTDTVSEHQIPCVDLSPFFASEINELAVQHSADRLVAVCQRYGFATVIGHGVSQDLLDEAFSWSKKLFDLPHEDKMKAPHPESNMPHRGYSSIGKEKVYSKSDMAHVNGQDNPLSSLRKVMDYKVWRTAQSYVSKFTNFDLQESYEIGNEADPDQTNIWLPEATLPGFRAFMVKLYWALNNSANIILQAFAMGMHVQGDELAAVRRLNSQHGNQLRLLHYPEIPLAQLEKSVLARLPAHTDWG